MAVSRDALGTKFLGNVSPLSSSTSINVTAAASCLVVELNVDDSNVSFSGVTWGGTALTRIGTISTSDTFCKTELWGLVNPASGSLALAVSWTGGTPTNVVACAVSYKGSQTTFSTCFPSADVVTLDTTSQTNSVTVTAPVGDYAFAAGNGSNQTTYSLNQTSVYSDTTTFISAAADAAGAGTVTFTATITGPGPATIHYSLIGCHIAAAASAVVGIALAAELFAPGLGPDWRPRNFQPRPAYTIQIATAALSARSILVTEARAGVSPKALVSAQSTAASRLAASPSGQAAISGKISAGASARSAVSGKAALQGAISGQAKASAAVSGLAVLAARSAAAAFAKVVPPGAIALLARAVAMLAVRAAPSGRAALQGTLKLQSSAAGAAGATVWLAALGRAAATSRANLTAMARLAASGATASFGRGGISAIANLGALSAMTRSALSARAAITAQLQLAGRSVLALTARVLPYIFEPSPRVAAPDYESRVTAATAESRVAAIPFEARIVAASTTLIAGQAMAVNWPNKDPAEIADYDLDWTLRLNTADAITGSSWAVTGTDAPTGTPIAIQSSSFIPTRAKVWLTGGNLGFTYSLQNTITTQNGDTLVQTAKILIKKK